MECRWDSALLQNGNQLPAELLRIIQEGTNQSYLATLTQTTLDPRFTHIILAHCEDILSQICASLRRHASFASTIATLGRIVPYAPYLSYFASLFLENEDYDWKSSTGSNDDLLYLLGLFRLLQFDRQKYIKFVRPAELAPKLRNSPRSVAFLVIRVLQIYLDGSDAWFEYMVARYVSDDDPNGDTSGVWDEKVIDYRFLTLWEEDRRERILNTILAIRTAPDKFSGTSSKLRLLGQDLFDPNVALIGGTLLPCESSSETWNNIVNTVTVGNNLRLIAQSLKTTQPILLTGPAGAGKTILIRHTAQQLGKLDRMVTLHLNEQSDAKLLLGIYTTGDKPGSFIWKPGVLTTAVREGRWVLIEDLDRAPTEVLGVLLPLIERQELFIPNRKETVVAAQGFRLFATVRTFTNYRNKEVNPLNHMLGQRHWRSVSLSVPAVNELGLIVRGMYSNLGPFLPQLMAVYETLLTKQSTLLTQSKTGVARLANARDFIKWCQRVSLQLDQKSTFTSSDTDMIYLEAIDCFVVALPSGQARQDLSASIAEELRIDPQRRDHLLINREARYESSETKITIGRYSLPRARNDRKFESSFSTNSHTTRMLECVTGAVINREPLLLVGETGVGKTTAVQHLASQLGRRLVAFNMSQQSEAGDLLGGFKPVSSRSIIVPMKDEFDELFSESFSSNKNQQFLQVLNKQVIKANWKRVCKSWRDAWNMVEKQIAISPPRDGEGPSKKRKIDLAKPDLRSRWETFAAKLDIIEQRLAGADEEFAFTFVEGNIVKALRDGDWVLLDEINLAAPDTLESITDLLDPDSPSLLLTEAGNIERIVAHPNFRIFAAMNPATDVGKKDLPPGIRSRFTEIYVESPDRDAKCLQSIVQAYLRRECIADSALASNITEAYQAIVSLAEDNKLVDGAGQKPHFSLRTLTRTLSYAKRIQQLCNIRRAMYEGFQMSFMTFLDDESAQLVEPLIRKFLFVKRTNVQAELQKPLRMPDDGQEYVRGHPESKHWLRKGQINVEDQSQYIITPFVRKNLENLVRAASSGKFPVLIQGPTSSGKTSMIEYLAKRSGHKFVRINNHEHTDLQEYLGTYVSGVDGRLEFQEGVLVKALREGHWVVLDELNLAPTDVLEALNRLLDDNRELLIPETQEIVRPHEDFMLFATQNPAGLYGGRKILSRAFRNRFLELHFDDIPIHELQEILHRRTELPESRCRRIVNVYKELSVLRQENQLFEQKSFATLRDLFRWALRPNDTIEQLAQNGYMLLCERVRKEEERVALKAIIEKVMSAKGPRVTIDEEALYSQDCVEIRGHDATVVDENVVWTRAMRRLYVLVSRAIQNIEPVLLVGETGCGKTTVCQMIANALQKNLHMVNAHQNTETGDLIGSQRPVRNRTSIESELRNHLSNSTLLDVLDTTDMSTDDMLHDYDQAVRAMDSEQRKMHTRSDLHSTILSLRTRFHALFEWVDGSLVQALRNGDFFLLDEISLADDSVLERLNSVLEPSRTILLAEKGALDSAVTATSGFQFFATMNPGGDYGKRELSPALRNRFTEIWVPALTDSADILQIVQAKLHPDAHQYAEVMVRFAAWFKERFDTSVNSAVSIRDTLAWVQFINLPRSYSIEEAVVHGAAMVYIDTLGANPAGLMNLTMHSLEQERRACLEMLDQLMQSNAQSLYDKTIEVNAVEDSFSIGPFKLPRAPEAQDDISFSFEPFAARSNAMRVLRALQLLKPIMLEGSPGVGKTALVTAISQAVGMPLTRINLSDQTDLLDLFGSDAPVDGEQTGTFAWRDAPFLRAMKAGEWVLLDEMNLASQSILEGLNACLDHRGEVYVPELGQTFSRHRNFRLFAAQNPHHQGGGRKGLPASFVNRFTVVYADSFKEDDLNLICRRKFPSMRPEEIRQAVNFVTKLSASVSEHRKFGTNGSPWEFNIRDISRWLEMAASNNGFLGAGSAKDFIDMLFVQRFRTTADKTCVEDLVSSIYHGEIFHCDLHTCVSPRSLQVGLAILPRDILQGTAGKPHSAHPQNFSHTRIIQSMMVCIQQSCPVILSGSPGSGKTALIERLAATTGASVCTLSMNAETDAMDLIGGYEQHDPRRALAENVALLQYGAIRKIKTMLRDNPTPAAIELLHHLHSVERNADRDSFAHILHDLKTGNDLHEDLTISDETPQEIGKARFEWINGPLIEAMRQGRWLVLDNANLCSPSVLDRLNSLLEPKGVLLLNEHTGPDGTPLILQPHPDFRVFLTIDPRLGELSRAMRNRAVELHVMSATPAISNTLVDPLAIESSMTRFRAVKSLYDDSGSTHNERRALVAVIRDHFALRDETLVPRLLRQLDIGLYRDCVGNSLEECKQLMSELAPSPEKAFQLETFYKKCQPDSCLPIDCTDVQTFHPLNNQPFIQRSQQVFLEAHSLATFFETKSFLTPLEKAFSSSKSDRTLLQRLDGFLKLIQDCSSTQMPRASTVMEMFLSMLRQVSSWLLRIFHTDMHSLVESQHSVFGFISLCRHFLESLGITNLDPALYNAHLASVKNLCLNAKSGTASSLFEELGSMLSKIHSTGNQETGFAFVPLWEALRPVTPPSYHQLTKLIEFETLVDQFDSVAVSQRLPLETIVDLRLSFQKALTVGNASNNDIDVLASQITTIAGQTGLMENQERAHASPHFARSFELICQQLAKSSLAGPTFKTSEVVSLEALAGRMTSNSMTCSKNDASQAPQRSLKLLGLCTPHKLDLVQPLGNEILQSISSTATVSMRDFRLLEDEIATIGRTMAAHTHLLLAENLSALDLCLRNLLISILRACLDDAKFSSLRASLEHILEQIDSNSSSSPDRVSELITLLKDKLLGSTVSRLAHAAQYLCTPSSSHRDKLSMASTAWVSFAITSLELFIPDSPSDPVTERQVERSIYTLRKTDIESNLSAVQAFTSVWSGEGQTLRSRSLQNQLHELGPEPTTLQICRPPNSSGLVDLLAEFRRLLQNLKSLRQVETAQLRSTNLKSIDWSNIQEIRRRLVTNFRAYADIATPVVGFIDCLQIARHLSSQAAAEDTIGEGIMGLDSVTPLCGATVHHWLSDDIFVSAFHNCTTPARLLYWLSIMAVRCRVMPISETSQKLQFCINQGFQHFYTTWEEGLAADQKAAAAKSSLYKYRDLEVDGEVDAEEFNQLFPAFEESATAQPAGHGSSFRPQDHAAQIAGLYRSVFTGAGTDREDLQDLLHHFSLLPPSDRTTIDQLRQGSMLLFAMRRLGDSTGLTSSSKPPPANIYKHPNISEAKMLITTIKKTRHTFNSFHQSWPEHAVPIDVVRLCDQILDGKHSEPLMKHLPFVEKLYHTVNEWQKIASSEYNAGTILKEISDLIIRWRQLELSTWAALFDDEDRACEAHASVWWFIAYATIVMAADTLHQSNGESLPNLIKTLGEFLNSCGLGEFKQRLQMLRDFLADLTNRARTSPEFSEIRSALSIVVAYYSHFEQRVEQSLSHGRQELENKIKEVIKTAGWNQRNIEILRSNSKASHKKLFRLVRKYRQLLSDPVTPLVHGDFPNRTLHEHIQHEAQSPSLPLRLTSKGKLWPERTTELKDPLVSSQAMRTEIEDFCGKSYGSKKIKRFIDNLENESAELRKATPGLFTEENKAQIQHLKTRKRLMLANVLKDVRLMGFQANLSDDALIKQQTFNATIAESSLLGFSSIGSDAADSDYEFLRLLHVMPTMREAASKPSDDLTPAEVARCKVLIESMLHVSLEQRKILDHNLESAASLKLSLSLIRSLAACQSPLPAASAEDSTAVLQTKIVMCTHVVDIVLHCVETQAKLAQRDYSDVIRDLESEIAELAVLNGSVKKLDRLPGKISSGDKRDLAKRYELLDQRIKEIIDQKVVSHPELEPNLSHLVLWSGKRNDQNGHPDMGTTTPESISDWTHNIFKVTETLPHLVSTATSAREKSKDTKLSKSWLLEQRSLLEESTNALNVQSVHQNLNHLLDSVLSGLSHDENSVRQLCAICVEIYPVWQAYGDAVDGVVAKACALNSSLNNMARRLATSFTQLASQGFCAPPEKGEKDENQSGDVQSGTGLGDGEGAEDISKDIGADEDLSELAQETGKDDKEQEVKAEKDAVDMADEDLQGEFEEDGEGSDEEEGDGDERDSQADADLDEETGHIGDDDKNAVDEKMRNDDKVQEGQEKESQNAQGEKTDDVGAAEEKKQHDENADGDKDGDVDMNEPDEDEEGSDSQVDQGGYDNDQVDPHTQMEETLELPEDMMMDGEKAGEDDMSDFDEDFGDDAPADEDIPLDENGKEVDQGHEENGEIENAEETGEALEQDDNVNSPEPEDDESKSDIAMLDKEDDMQRDANDGLVSGEDGTGLEKDDVSSKARQSAMDESQLQDDTQDVNSGDGTEGGTKRTQNDVSSSQADETGEEQSAPEFKQLGDMLKEWYNQQREIQSAMDREKNGPNPPEDTDKANMQFEHLPEDVESDMQALGAASAEQSKPLNHDMSVSVNETEPEDLPMPIEETTEELNSNENELDVAMPDAETVREQLPAIDQSKAMIGARNDMEMDMDGDINDDQTDSDDLTTMDEQLTKTHISNNDDAEAETTLSMEEAHRLWSEHETRTRNMSIILTEHLRLILHPTQATKLRGDFRTGKRLNIKKIIPYIASSYKRDKIWLRRSVPSKRSYQILLAIDDSNSMTESDSRALAFDTLALISKSMTMLEVGEISIVGFGEEVKIAHEFGAPFTSEAGAEVFRKFTFSQRKTDVRKLVERALEVFGNARLRAHGSASELWQLMLVVSDGICEEHAEIRRLVRAAMEERIMIVFIVMDSTATSSAAGQTGAGGQRQRQSILDLKSAEFTEDGSGEPQLRMVRYLDTFPFGYYLIVRDVQELPGVLAGALRQWFAEVVDTGV